MEVKTKSSDFFGLPREMVDEHKIYKIEQVATSYLMAKRLVGKRIRFDVVEVFDDKINHLVNAW